MKLREEQKNSKIKIIKGIERYPIFEYRSISMEIKFKTKKISNVEKKIDVNTNKKGTWEIMKRQKTQIGRAHV